eukprot:TRINITY_DN69921_c0_g1_i1.p1 TRINITY_DN69921_c0_g1~~TRINITY_DN69921_c0_g1_i1.p1  ORF type:complete len:217 (+),score=48.31 TRINITY_DN69921_c0_g1_i1:60-710(+)
MEDCIGCPLVVQVSVDHLELGGLPQAQASVFVLVLRALGEIYQTAPLETSLAEGHLGTCECCSFCAYFDASWSSNALRRLLAKECLRIELLQVPLEDAAVLAKADFGAQRIAAYRICPWPWVQRDKKGLCSMAQGRHEAKALDAPLLRWGDQEADPWLRLRLSAKVAEEIPLQDRDLEKLKALALDKFLKIPEGGDVFEVPGTSSERSEGGNVNGT